MNIFIRKWGERSKGMKVNGFVDLRQTIPTKADDLGTKADDPGVKRTIF